MLLVDSYKIFNQILVMQSILQFLQIISVISTFLIIILFI